MSTFMIDCPFWQATRLLHTPRRDYMRRFNYLIAAIVAAIFTLGMLTNAAVTATPQRNATVVTLASAPTTLRVTSRPAVAIKTVRTLANGQTVQTFAYGTEPDQVGDVYYDTDWAAGSHPAIVVIHGGWWHNAQRANAASISQKWLDAGFVVFN